LANLPADGDEFVESGFVDQVAGVVLGIPAQKRRETGFRDRHFGEQCLNRFGGIEGGRGKARSSLTSSSMGTRCGIGRFMAVCDKLLSIPRRAGGDGGGVPGLPGPIAEPQSFPKAMATI